jgi:short-subunit dehydrogenase
MNVGDGGTAVVTGASRGFGAASLAFSLAEASTLSGGLPRACNQ